MRTHARTMKQAEKKFGVDRQVITSIILVESNLGRYLGRKSILNTLSTMAALNDPGPREFLWMQLPEDRRFDRLLFDQRADQKKDWAYKELKAFLSYTDGHKIDPESVTGSYAGAMGIAQFMPSNIIAFGQDGDGDGRIDLFNSADSIFSIAGYLNNFGWRPGLKCDQAYNVLYNYNRSKYYVDTVLQIADLLKN
jgi:membrane-bound lytic murein transglycosylase B